MKMRLVFCLCLVLFVSAACTTATQVPAEPTSMLPAQPPTAVSAIEPATAVPAGATGAITSTVPADWQTYTNPAGFSIKYPANWTQQEQPPQAQGTYNTVTLQGTEGAVDLSWGSGFGGACPQGYSTVKVAEGELPTCYSKNADGTESWTQINKELQPGVLGFSGAAKTSNAEQASHDLILQILSTLSFGATQ